jgi:hypothetical protein
VIGALPNQQKSGTWISAVGHMVAQVSSLEWSWSKTNQQQEQQKRHAAEKS